MSRQQIHGQDRRPSRMQFHAPVRYENIRGPWRVSIAFEAPVIVWGDGERCLRQETYERRGAYLNPFCHEGAY